MRSAAPVWRGWRLRDRRIRTKLAVIIAVPILAVLVLTGLRVTSAAARAERADRAHDLVVLGAMVAEITAELQHERVSAALVCIIGSSPILDSYRAQTHRTDEVISRYQRQRARSRPAANFDAMLRRIDSELSDLVVLRQQVQVAPDAVTTTMVFRYRAVIADLITFRNALCQTTGVVTRTTSNLRADATLSQAIESLGLMQAAVTRVLAAGGLNPAGQQEIVSADARYVEAVQSFREQAPLGWRAQLNATVTGPVVAEAERLHGVVARAQPGGPPAIGTDLRGWVAIFGTRMDLLHQVEARLDLRVALDVAAQRDAARRDMATVSGSVGLGLLLMLAICWWVTRSLVHSLTMLRVGAYAVATVRLPRMVERLDGTHTPPEVIEDLVNQAVEPLRIAGRDEVGQVAAAFATVSGNAVRIAAEQAALRSDVRAIYMVLARRLQRRVDTVMARLDQVQAGETDSARLKRIFDLDHAATLLRRMIADLQVLAGGRAGRARPQAVALPDLLRAAQGEIEQYLRVEFRAVDQDVMIDGEVAEELSHLLAGLLDNSVRFSPDPVPVLVEARKVGDVLYVHIQDHGVGMTEDQLLAARSRLANPDSLDRQVTERMGLAVVSAIAHRLGVHIEVRSDPGCGTRVTLTVPPAVIRPSVPVSVPVPGGRAAVPGGRAVVPGGRAPAVARAQVPGSGNGRGYGPVGPVGPVGHGPAVAPVPRRPQVPARIYQELEHTWFSRPVPGAPPPVAGCRAQEAARAAAVVFDLPVPTKQNTAGLPVRTPMARLVPPVAGGPGQPAAAIRRDAEEVRRRTTAFHQGLAAAGRRPYPAPHAAPHAASYPAPHAATCPAPHALKEL